MDDFEFICMMLEKYLVKHKVDYETLTDIMLFNGMTTEEYRKWCNVVFKGDREWPEFAISVVSNSRAVLQ